MPARKSTKRPRSRPPRPCPHCTRLLAAVEPFVKAANSDYVKDAYPRNEVIFNPPNAAVTLDDLRRLGDVVTEVRAARKGKI